MSVILATQEAEQEDHGLKPAGANGSQEPISKIPNTKRTGGVAQGVGPELKPWYRKERERERKEGRKERKDAVVVLY
jgi:hypothetical protein